MGSVKTKKETPFHIKNQTNPVWLRLLLLWAIVSLGSIPHPVTVTIRIITLVVGNHNLNLYL